MTKEILMIEDDNFLRETFEKQLSLNSEYKFIGFDSAEKAFDYLENSTPNIIILDLVLPRINGYEILEKVRKNEKTKNVPVIIFSNLYEKKDIERASSLGIVDFMIKSNNSIEELIDRIKSIL
jgi:DNA-binding response OmpR family regulator